MRTTTFRRSWLYEQVRPGDHAQPNNLYGLLRTLLDAYDLDPLGHSAEAEPIDVWKNAQ